MFIKDLIEISSLTYESNPIEMDAVLVQGDNFERLLESIDADFIRISGDKVILHKNQNMLIC